MLSGAKTLALTSHYMRHLIRENGHLQLDGTEKVADLREALMNLRRYHTHSECHRLELGTPIDALIPDIRTLAKPSTKPRNVKSVDIPNESL